MNRHRRLFPTTTWKTAAFVALFETSVFAGVPLFTYNGLFPAGHEPTAKFTYNMLLDKPRRVMFAILDEKGVPQLKVRVVEVTPASSGGGMKDPNGISQADLNEPGIYDIKVAIDPSVSGELGFVLKVADTGEAIAAVKQPVSPDDARQDGTEKRLPVVPETPPSMPSTTVTPDAPLVVPAKPASSPKLVEVTPSPGNEPDKPASPVKVPLATAASSSQSTTKLAPNLTLPVPTGTQTSLGIVAGRYPAGTGYADPYKPVEILFDRDLPTGLPLEKVLKLFIRTASGQEKVVEGQYFPAGRNGIRFLPKKLSPGAVCTVKVTDLAGTSLDEFTFQTFPTLRMSLSKTDEGVQADLSWPVLPDLLPAAEGQAVRLESSELVLTNGPQEIARFPFTPDLAPFGSHDDLRFQGRPFGFTLVIPASRVSTSDAVPLSMALFIHIAGREGSLEVARATLTSHQGSPAPAPTAISSASASNPTSSPTFTPASSPSAAVAPAPAIAPGTVSPATDSSPAISPPLPVTNGGEAASGSLVPSERSSGSVSLVATSSLPASASSVPLIPPLLLPSDTTVLETTIEPSAASETVSTHVPASSTPASGQSPATRPTSVPEPIVQKPVLAIADPGPQANLVPELDFTVTEGAASAGISWPRGCVWGPDGSLWVADSQNRRVMRFNDEGRLMHAFGKKGKGPGLLGVPIDIAVCAAGVFVSDTAAHVIHLFDIQGAHQKAIGSWGTKPGQIDLPHGLVIADDQIWVAERGNAQIMRFGIDGAFRGSFGKRGELPGYLENPIAVRIHNGTVWVLEPGKGRVQRFTKEGKYLGGFIAGVKDAVDLEIDPWGNPWVADGEGRRVIRYDPSGKLLMTVGSPAGGRPWIPTSVSMRSDGLLAVGDGNNRSIRLFRLKKP
ncbi:MAG: hypothetical protein WA705_01260 [Candidatus Ozemobacteraceae bacterium]